MTNPFFICKKWYNFSMFRLKTFLHNFMAGRYGPDHLGAAMVIVSLGLYLVSIITGLTPIIYVSYMILALTFFRMLSLNIIRRRTENDKFIRYWWPIKTKLNRRLANIKHRKTHKFFKCPSCSNTLRVPKGKGRLQVTCPKCGERFIKKT